MLPDRLNNFASRFGRKIESKIEDSHKTKAIFQYHTYAKIRAGHMQKFGGIDMTNFLNNNYAIFGVDNNNTTVAP